MYANVGIFHNNYLAGILQKNCDEGQFLKKSIFYTRLGHSHGEWARGHMRKKMLYTN